MDTVGWALQNFANAFEGEKAEEEEEILGARDSERKPSDKAEKAEVKFTGEVGAEHECTINLYGDAFSKIT